MPLVLAEVYGATISEEKTSKITGSDLGEITEWSRPGDLRALSVFDLTHYARKRSLLDSSENAAILGIVRE